MNNIHKVTQKSINVLTTMKSKIPLFALGVNQAIVTHIYDHDNHNSHNTNELNTIFWSYMPLLIFLTGISEFFFLYFKSKGPANTPNKLDTKDYVYCSLNSIISMGAFISTTYYINNGEPYMCIFNYDKNIAAIQFYMTYAIIFVISYIEQHMLSKIPKKNNPNTNFV